MTGKKKMRKRAENKMKALIEKEVARSCFFFFNWYSLHARLNSHYEAWSYKKRKHKKVKAYRKSI